MWPFKKKMPALPAVKEEPSMFTAQDPQLSLKDLLKKQYIHPVDYMEAVGDFDRDYFRREFEIYANAGKMKSLYSTEPWVFATASIIAKAMTTVPMLLKDTSSGEVIENHPVNDIIQNGNPISDEKSLNWAGYVDLVMTGNFFRALDEKGKYQLHIPSEYVTLRTRENKSQVVTDLEDIISGIELTSNDDDQNFIEYKYLVHHKLPNPYNPLYGQSLYISLIRAILNDRNKSEYELAFYLRGASNAGVVETGEDLGRSRFERWLITFSEIFTGRKNWWRPVILPKGAKWVNTGTSIKDMQHIELLRQNVRTILAVLGVPPSQVGIVEDVNRSTAETQETAFWQNTIVPLCDFVAAGWNNSYLIRNMYKGSVYVEPDYSGIEALEGSFTVKGERITAMAPVLVINELREMVGYPPLKATDPRGNKFVAEIGLSLQSAGFVTDPGEGDDGMGPEMEDNDNPPPDVEDIEEADKASLLNSVKTTTIASQERIESQQGKKYIKVLKSHVDRLLSKAVDALLNNKDVRSVLLTWKEDREEKYMKDAEPILLETLEKGFVLANANAKSLTRLVSKKDVKQGKTSFTPEDEQAIEAIRESTREYEQTGRIRDAITSFQSFDETQTEHILNLIESGMEQGKTNDQIAADLRSNYDESYGDQSFTITRTEILSSVSQGLWWNHDALNKVFSEVQKQWFHVGDVGINPNARENHLGFEKEGPKPNDYLWGNTLGFPRDPRAPAGEVINCRCSMASVIPENATSFANMILETEG